MSKKKIKRKKIKRKIKKVKSLKVEKKQLEIESSKSFFITKGFTLVYDDQLYANKLVGSKIEKRSLIIFQKNLKKNTDVKITNLNNSKYIIVKVGKKTNYPIFFNSVISQRISKELEIDQSDPYVEIIEIHENYGSIPLYQILKPAIKYAEEGVILGAYQSYIFELIKLRTL